MRGCVALGGMMTSLAVLCGCSGSQTTVELVNAAEFPVEVRLFFDDDQNLTEVLLEADGEERNITVQPGQTETFSEDCEELQAIFIEDADLRIVGEAGPDASTGVYREPDDFGCGDTLRFRFTQNALATDLDIGFNQS